MAGIHLGHGLGFVASYGWLTAYYVVPWVLFPATAAWLDGRDARAAARGGAVDAP